MDFNASVVITEFLSKHEDIFTVEEFWKYLKERSVKVNKLEAEDILRSSIYVFPLVNHKFVTRCGVFQNRWFSFKPSKEEVEKGYIILGHRTMPFTNFEVSPDNLNVVVNGNYIEAESVKMSMNQAMDTFALFGEGYVIPYILNDKSNETIPLSSVQYSLPTEVCLTAWPLEKIAGKENFQYGDRLLCRVVDWSLSEIEITVQKNSTKEFVVSSEAIEREQWYSDFEQAIITSFDRHGPADSIDEQLSFLFLENQEELCIRNCGSIEEFLAHTTKISFEPYGVESRIWRKGEVVPFAGVWNSCESIDQAVYSDVAASFSPAVIDAFLENNIYLGIKGKENNDLEDLLPEMFPLVNRTSPSERRLVLLNIEKRNDILRKNYNSFKDYSVADLRKRILQTFSQVNKLYCSIGSAGLKTEDFPQQELVILSQLYSHFVRLLEEVENPYLRDQIPVDDVSLSLEGMEETFEDIKGTLKSALDKNQYKAFEIVNGGK